MKRIRKIIFCLMFILSLSLIMPVQAKAAPKISKKAVTLTKGSSKKLKVSGTKKKVKWTSSKKAVASVNSKGKVTAKKPGKAKITAKFGKKKLVCKVTVKKSSAKKSSAKKSSAKKSSAKKSSAKKSSGKKSAPGEVWITSSGEKYHRSRDCSNMRNPYKVSLSDAKASGREACSKCF